MKNLFVNRKNGTIEMSKKFAAAAANPFSDEYAQLQSVRRDYPKFKIVIVSQKTAKPDFKGLTYEYMEDYIMTHGSAETVRANLKEFYEKRLIAECHGKAFRYPAIKRWFLEKYPEITEHGMEKTAQIIEIYDEPEENKTEEQDASA